MRVNPGWGGQSPIESPLKKGEKVRKKIEPSGKDIK
jgi:Pentose-5-phosphate-3-epimerase